MFNRIPFSGTQRGLVIAIDIGTTYSGVSFSVLDPGVVPEIKTVTRFPAQLPGGASKIPSVLYYDSTGKVRAIGAETLLESTIEAAEEEKWHKVEWFKMHLRPKSGLTTKQISSLPPLKSLTEVFADFLRYMFSCAREFIEETLLPDGAGFWASVKDRAIFVLSHPNGWEGPQQNYMRRAAVLGGLVDYAGAEKRIQFVTEGEASLHFCINNGLTIKVRAENEGIIIVDAGGGTIDLSAYSSSKSKDGNILFEEVTQPECCFAGSIFVTEESRIYFEDKLQGSQFYSDVSKIAECFDQTTKLQFRDSGEPSYVRFGGVRDRDPALDIRSGQMKIPGAVVARFFEPSIKAILQAIARQRSDSRKVVNTVFIVGGFAASPWLFSRLKEDLTALGIEVYRPDTHVNKAVSDGAASFYLDHFVKSRISRFSYGLKIWSPHEASNPEHQIRPRVLDSVTGEYMVENIFRIILKKGVQVSEEQEFRASFASSSTERFKFKSVNILRYIGANEEPSWIDLEPEMYSNSCTVSANASHISSQLPVRRNPSGALYYDLEFDVVLLFGLTELKAQIAWKKDGVEMRSPAAVVYEEKY
ncbi:hypothetical protein GYMLUDRAFT_228044, partial [Collybiopsis luxurians FD-317 M1]